MAGKLAARVPDQRGVRTSRRATEEKKKVTSGSPIFAMRPGAVKPFLLRDPRCVCHQDIKCDVEHFRHPLFLVFIPNT